MPDSCNMYITTLLTVQSILCHLVVCCVYDVASRDNAASLVLSNSHVCKDRAVGLENQAWSHTEDVCLLHQHIACECAQNHICIYKTDVRNPYKCNTKNKTVHENNFLN